MRAIPRFIGLLTTVTALCPPGCTKLGPAGETVAEQGQCAHCHQAPPPDASHLAHRSNDCSVCHAGNSVATSSTSPARHGNGTVDVDGRMEGGRYSPAAKSCAGTYCHGNPVGGNSVTPVWGGSLTCGSCHDTVPATGRHAKHHQKGITCESCHSGYSLSSSTAPPVTHANRIIEVNGALGGGTYDSTTRRCSNSSCHKGYRW